MVRKKFKGTIALFLAITITIFLLGFASACHCGDGIINQQSEECDGTDLGDATCTNVMGAGYTGTLSCSQSCTLVTNNCIVPESCTVTVTKPTSGWYGGSVNIEWEYSSGCNVATQLIQRGEGDIRRDIKYIGNNYSTSNIWYLGDNWFEEGNFSLCIYAGLVNHTNAEGCSSEFGIDLTPPIIFSSDRTCDEGDVITLTASATDALSGVDASTWKWDLDNNGIYETPGQSVSYTCLDGAAIEIVKVKVADNVGNFASKNVIIAINSPEPECEYDIGIKKDSETLNYSGTGIGIKIEGGDWSSNNSLLEGNYLIGYYVKNKKDILTNIRVITKLDNLILNNYTKSINSGSYHSNYSVKLDTQGLCGAHTLYLEVQTLDGFECNLTDNYAERQIYIECEEEPPTPYCGDGECNGNENCSTCPEDCGDCSPVCSVCGNGVLEAGEECDDGNLINGDGCSSRCRIEDEDYKAIKSVEFVQFCNTNWKCTGWSECSDGISTRSCYDKNNCDIKYNKPIEQMDCENFSKVYAEEETVKPFWIFLGIILFILLVLVLVNLL